MLSQSGIVVTSDLQSQFAPKTPKVRKKRKTRKPKCSHEMQHLVHAVTNLALPVSGALKAILVALVVRKGLDDLLLRIEDKGAVLHDGLIERSASNEDLGDSQHINSLSFSVLRVQLTNSSILCGTGIS